MIRLVVGSVALVVACAALLFGLAYKVVGNADDVVKAGFVIVVLIVAGLLAVVAAGAAAPTLIVVLL
jgi:hypothetical protein